MKGIKLVIVLVSLSFAAKAQNYNKGSMSADVQAGIDIYDTEYTTHYTFNGFDTTIVSTDKAGCKNISLGFEYEVIKKLGVGVRLKFNNYFTSEDSITKTKPTVKSQDYMLCVNYHLVDKDKFDLGGGISVGASRLLYKENNSENDMIKGQGPYIQFQLSPRFIIKKKLGLGISIYSPIVNYNKMTSNNDDVNQHVISKWKGSGYGFSFGISYLISTK